MYMQYLVTLLSFHLNKMLAGTDSANHHVIRNILTHLQNPVISHSYHMCITFMSRGGLWWSYCRDGCQDGDCSWELFQHLSVSNHWVFFDEGSRHINVLKRDSTGYFWEHLGTLSSHVCGDKARDSFNEPPKYLLPCSWQQQLVLHQKLKTEPWKTTLFTCILPILSCSIVISYSKR